MDGGKQKELRVAVCVRGCVLTHGSPEAVCVFRVVAEQNQADAGSCQQGPAPGEPSCASGRHTQSFLWVRKRGGMVQISKKQGDRWEISRER